MRTNVSVHLTFLVLKNIFAFVMFAITSKLYKFGEKIYRNVPNQVTTQLLSNEKFSPGLRYSNTIWVPDKKDGYRTQKEVSTKQHIIDGFKQLKNEVEVWRNEVKEHLLSDPVLIFRAGEVDALWTFSDDNDRKKFIVSADSDHNEGTSTCSLTKSPAGYGLFSGTLNSQPPLNGKVKRAGYCNITCMRPMKSFQRESYFDWTAYNKLVFRVRGDGRAYMINLHTPGFFDVTWHDAYHYVLYTRGGPHWQYTEVPFSKFMMAAHTRVQDKQAQMERSRIARLGITAASLDFTDGDFNLEIDYIGLVNDPNHTEEFSYELYKTPNFVVGSA